MRAPQASKFDASAPHTVVLLGECPLSVVGDAPADEVIGAVAERQRGRVARSQLLAAGVQPSAIDRRLRNKRLEWVHCGVYGLPHTSDVPLAAETAALLACGEGAVLSHHSAITLWGLRTGEARPVHVTIPVGRRGPAPDGVKLHRSRILAPRDTRIFQGLPVTSPARALLDVAATLPDRDVERLLYEAILARRLLTPGEIADILRRAGRHAGRRRLARVAGAPQSDTSSRAAEALLAMIRAAGLPEPRTEVPVLDYRLDLFWPELNLAVEVDAYGTHGSRARFESDRRRDARLLTELGIVVIRITRVMIGERPREALALVARAIGQREAAIRSLRSRSR
jgi:very-short-patch-repair endonuclease